MKRRDFLKAAALTGLATTLKWKDGMDLMAQKQSTGSKIPDLVAVMGGEPAAMFRKAIVEMGGMGRFVKKGQRVTIKPNIGWDRSPERAANTNPELVAEIVRRMEKMLHQQWHRSGSQKRGCKSRARSRILVLSRSHLTQRQTAETGQHPYGHSRL